MVLPFLPQDNSDIRESMPMQGSSPVMRQVPTVLVCECTSFVPSCAPVGQTTANSCNYTEVLSSRHTLSYLEYSCASTQLFPQLAHS